LICCGVRFGVVSWMVCGAHDCVELDCVELDCVELGWVELD
jgi:hypothetical protein